MKRILSLDKHKTLSKLLQIHCKELESFDLEIKDHHRLKIIEKFLEVDQFDTFMVNMLKDKNSRLFIDQEYKNIITLIKTSPILS